MTLELDQKARDFLIDKGYNPDYGARPLRRAISAHIEDPLAESLLAGEFKSGHKILVTRKDDAPNLYFEATPMPKDEVEGDGDKGNGGSKPSPDSPSKQPAKTGKA